MFDRLYSAIFGGCCTATSTGNVFQLRKQTTSSNKVQISFAQNLKQAKKEGLLSQTTQVIRINKSQYDNLISNFNNTTDLWLDHQFPPAKSSLGQLKIQDKWNRISQLVEKPVLLGENLTDFWTDINKNQLLCKDNVFYSVIAALSDHKRIFQNLFFGQKFNSSGLYKVPLKINGQIQQIIVDDFVPVMASNSLTSSLENVVFCTPVNNEVWMLVLQKAWAKVRKGYDKINTSPTQIMKAFTWAPVEQIYIKNTGQEKEKYWKKLVQYCEKKYPCICQTIAGDQGQRFQLDGLYEDQVYSILDAFQIQDSKGKGHRILKMRSFVGIDDIHIRITQKNDIWQELASRQKITKGSQIQKSRQNTIFYINFDYLIKYFSKMYISLYDYRSNYLSQSFNYDPKRGSLYSFVVKKEGHYNIQLHQPTKDNQSLELKQEGSQLKSQYQINDQVNNGHMYKRGTIILIKEQVKEGKNQFVYSDGVLSLNQKDTLLSVELNPGKYFVFAKLDSLQNETQIQTGYSISIYSKQFAEIIKENRSHYPDILQKAFLSHGRQTKRSKYNNDLMWISYKLFYKQGGYAYIAIGNSLQSNKKFIITFDKDDFKKINFKLKKPFKTVEGVQTLTVEPGEEKIILARVIDKKDLTSLKFPPQLGIKMQPVEPKP